MWKKLRKNYKRVIAFMLTMAMTFSNMAANMTAVFAAAGEEEEALFVVDGLELAQALREAKKNGEDFDYSSLDLKARTKKLKGQYEKMLKDGNVYQLEMEIDDSYAPDGTGMEVFYNEETDDVIFLFINGSDLVVNFRASIDGYETEPLTIGPNAANVELDDEEAADFIEDAATKLPEKEAPKAEVVDGTEAEDADGEAEDADRSDADQTGEANADESVADEADETEDQADTEENGEAEDQTEKETEAEEVESEEETTEAEDEAETEEEMKAEEPETEEETEAEDEVEAEESEAEDDAEPEEDVPEEVAAVTVSLHEVQLVAAEGNREETLEEPETTEAEEEVEADEQELEEEKDEDVAKPAEEDEENESEKKEEADAPETEKGTEAVAPKADDTTISENKEEVVDSENQGNTSDSEDEGQEPGDSEKQGDVTAPENPEESDDTEEGKTDETGEAPAEGTGTGETVAPADGTAPAETETTAPEEETKEDKIVKDDDEQFLDDTETMGVLEGKDFTAVALWENTMNAAAYRVSMEDLQAAFDTMDFDVPVEFQVGPEEMADAAQIHGDETAMAGELYTFAVETEEGYGVASVTANGEEVEAVDPMEAEADGDTDWTEYENVYQIEVPEEELVIEVELEEALEGIPAATYTGECEDAVFTIEAPEGAFEEEVELKVTKIEDEEELAKISDQANAAVEGAVAGMLAYDVTFVSKETGEEVEPQAPVSVSVSLKTAVVDESVAKEDITGMSVVHVPDEGEAEEVAKIEAEGIAEIAATETTDPTEIKFEAESFSTYVITVNANAAVTIDEQTYQSLQAAIDSIHEGDAEDNEIKLESDIKENIVSDNKNFTLDMQGHTITASGASSSIISFTNGTLILRNGVLSGGISGTRDGSKTQGSAIYGKNANIKLHECNITNGGGTANKNKYVSANSSIYINAGQLTMSECKFFNNTASAAGGPIYIVNSTVSVEGGEFIGNKGNNSGLIYIEGGNATNVTIDNAQIRENFISGTTAAGVLYVANGNKVTINLINGEISGNTGGKAGAIYLYGGTPEVTVEGTVIKENVATYSSEPTAGGVYLGAGSFVMSSGALYKNTSKSKKASDLYSANKNFELPSASTMKDDDFELDSYGLTWQYYNNSYSTFPSTQKATQNDVIKREASRYYWITAYPSIFNDAKIGETNYSTLMDAIEAAGNNAVIDILAGKGELRDSIEAGEVIFDKNELTIRAIREVLISTTSITVKNGQTLNIKGPEDGVATLSGTINIEEGGKFIVGGKVTLTGAIKNNGFADIGGDVSCTGAITNGNTGVINFAGIGSGKLTNTGTIKISGKYSEAITNNLNGEMVIEKNGSCSGAITNNGELIIDGTSTSYKAFKNNSGGNLIVNGICSGIRTVINEGNLTVNGDFSASLKNEKNGELTINGKMISGGITHEGKSFILNCAIDSDTLVTLKSASNSITAGDNFEISETGSLSIQYEVLPEIGNTAVLIQNCKKNQGILDKITVQLSDMSKDVVVKYSDPNIVIEIAEMESGIYLGGENANDDYEGTAEKPVKTFSKAKELLIQKNQKVIYIIGEVKAEGEWTFSDMPDKDDYMIMRGYDDNNKPYLGNLITVDSGKTLTLNDIVIDGGYKRFGIESNDSTIRVKGGTLFVEEGTVLKNNCNVATGSSHRNKNGKGGAIYIEENGIVTLNGGKISSNLIKSSDPIELFSLAGGGIYISAGGKLTMEDGDISNNKVIGANGVGGGISLEDSDSTNKRNEFGDVNLNGGTISNNFAGTGGGIYIAVGNNLALKQVAVYDNQADVSYGGGGVWFCPQGKGKFYSTSGGLIAENSSYGYGQEFIGEHNTNKKNLNISSRYHDGNRYSWYEDSENSSEKIDDMKEWIQEQLDKYMDLSLRNDAKFNKEDTYYKLIITGNNASWGGGIGSNGSLIMGEDEDISLTVKKVWMDKEGNSIDDPPVENITVSLIRTDLDGGNKTIIESVELNADNKWMYTFKDLPAGYDWSVEETEVPGWKPEIGEKTEGEGRVYTITITNKPTETISVPVEKKWLETNGSNAVENLPESITVKLYRNGEPYKDMEITPNAAGEWKGEFAGLDKSDKDGIDYTYTVDEVAVAGWISDVNGYTIINTRVPEGTKGNLTVSKTVTGSRGDTTKEFTFTVTLSDTTINGTYGNMTFTNGVARFTLHHDQSVTAEGLPAGITYTVTETDNDGYTVSATGEMGTIPANDTATAAFTNYRGGGGGGGSSDSSGGNPPSTTTTIDNPDVPLANLPNETPDLVDLEEAETPLAALLPKTGDSRHMAAWMMLFGAAGVGMLGAALGLMKKHDEDGDD